MRKWSALGMMKMTATASVRSDLYINHMLGAAEFAREIAMIERENESNPLGDFFDALFHRSLAVALMSYAAKEGYLNAVLTDRDKHFDPRNAAIINSLWRKIERSSALEKADFVLAARGQPRLDRGTTVVEMHNAHKDLRDALVHYKPEWSTEERSHAKLSGVLQTKFLPNKWYKGDRMFPRAWAGSGAASWCVETSLEFVRTIAAAAGLPEPFAADYDTGLRTD